MKDIGPYSNYRLTVRLELANKPGIFAKVASALAEEQANLGAVDLVSATKTRMIRDVTFDVQNEEHGERVVARLGDIARCDRALGVRSYISAASRGQDQVRSKFPISTRNVLSMVYTPGLGVSLRRSRRDKIKGLYLYEQEQ